MRLAILLGSICIFLVSPLVTARAAEADLLAVRAYPLENGTWRFDVTLRHADEGWNHCATGWEILGPDAISITQRIVLHPHPQGPQANRRPDGFERPLPISSREARPTHGFRAGPLAGDRPLAFFTPDAQMERTS